MATGNVKNYAAIGNTGGKSFYKLTSAQSGLQAHEHDVPVYTGTVDGTGSQQGIKPTGATKLKTSTIPAKDALEDHENRMEYVVCAYIQRVKPEVFGMDGTTPHIGGNGNWFIGTTDTGVRAQATNGDNGVTPHIGGNGNWYFGATDTGVKATGSDGQSGVYASEIVASPTSGNLTLKNWTRSVLETALTNANVFSVVLPAPTAAKISESIMFFKIGATLPTITQPAGIQWRGKAPSLAINTTLTIIYDQINVTGSTYEIWAVAQ